MAEQRLILAIGRAERALARCEQYVSPIDSNMTTDSDLFHRHERLKAQTHASIVQLDSLIAKASQNG